MTDGREVVLQSRWASRGGVAIFPWPLAAVRGSFDVIHVQGPYPFLTEVAPLVARVAGVPSVLTYHFGVVGRNRPRAILAGAYGRGLVLAAPYFDRIIFATQSYSKSSLLAKGLRDGQAKIIPMGLDPAMFHVAWQVPKRQQILFVGRLVWFKGLSVLLEAFRVVAKRHPGCRLVIVGDGPLRGEVERTARTAGASVDFRPSVGDAELVGLYNESKVTVLPSIAQESFGMTLLESLACGTPVVASDLPGVRDVTALGGLSVPPGDPQALADALSARLQEDWGTDDRTRVSAQIAREFSWDSIAAETAALYQELI